MRIWSLHPMYLDTKGLVALWREALLAQAVLRGLTTGYTRHPQLDRFKACKHPVDAISSYLVHVLAESKSRGYRFNANKIPEITAIQKMTVTSGQLEYEMTWLKNKLKTRDTKQWEAINNEQFIQPHPIFEVVKGEIENWEKT